MNTTELAAPRLGVGAVIRNDRGEILMVLRNREPEKDTWSIPGGKIDIYETMEHGVVREIKEEVNLDIAVIGVLCTAETIRPEKAEHWVSVIYEAEIVGGELRNMEEGDLFHQRGIRSPLPFGARCYPRLANDRRSSRRSPRTCAYTATSCVNRPAMHTPVQPKCA